MERYIVFLLIIINIVWIGGFNMELSTKKYLYKLTINKKACGEVERGLREWGEESQQNS